MSLELDRKVALVTGTSGIARATAVRLRELGAAVLACGIDEAANDSLRRAEPGLQVRRADVSVGAEVEDCVRAVVETFGGLDIIVNCAAIHPFGTVVDTPPETWGRALAINLGSIYLTGHFGIPVMRQRGGGAIVNLASVQGHACQQGVAAYVAAKGAIHALTRAMALDHAADGIRVNSVSPGSVRTPMLAVAARHFDGPDADVEAVFAPLRRGASAEAHRRTRGGGRDDRLPGRPACWLLHRRGLSGGWWAEGRHRSALTAVLLGRESRLLCRRLDVVRQIEIASVDHGHSPWRSRWLGQRGDREDRAVRPALAGFGHASHCGVGHERNGLGF